MAEGRQTQVSKYSAELEQVCEAIHKSIEELEIGLSAIVRPSAPTVSDISAEDSETLVPHAEFLRMSVRKLSDAASKILDIRDRVEM